MLIFEQIHSLMAYVSEKKANKQVIGFVPTMGALHAGHISLIKQSTLQNEVTICSIFVNPTQFNQMQDLEKYPRTLEKDVEMLQNAGCSALFLPSTEIMYPEKVGLRFDFGYLEQVMEGKFRPNHFNGVALIVAKLFHITNPDVAYFGQKDLQQVAIIKQLVKDLSFPLQIVVGETVREANGLAMSSRNMRLSTETKEKATHLYKALVMAKTWIISEENINFEEIKQQIKHYFENKPFITLEYFEIIEVDTLQNVFMYQPQKTAICIAAHIEGIRLIDNIIF